MSLKEYEVNFILHSNLYIDADSEEEAREIANKMINNRIKDVGNVLYGVAIDSDDYTTDVIKL